MFYLVRGLVFILVVLLCGGLFKASKDQDDTADKFEDKMKGEKGA